jgi:hypothetical protein
MSDLADEGKQARFNETITANVSCYYDKDGNFDMKQFIDSVEPEIKEKNK